MPVLTSTFITVSSFLSRQLRGSIPSTLWLTAYLLAVLRLKLGVTTQPPRTRYPVAGQPSGAGFTPAGLHDLARPHNSSVPFFTLSPFRRTRISLSTWLLRSCFPPNRTGPSRLSWKIPTTRPRPPSPRPRKINICRLKTGRADPSCLGLLSLQHNNYSSSLSKSPLL